MSNNQIVLHLNNALFALGYARQKLAGSEFEDRAEDISNELQNLASEIYGAPVLGGPLGAPPSEPPVGMNGPADPGFDPPYDKGAGFSVKPRPSDAAYKATDKVQFLEEFEGIKSVEPAEIIGASVLFMFNSKNRALTVFHCPEGFQIKGTTIQNHADTSYSKTLRWPDKQLPQILDAVDPVAWLDAIKAVAKPVTGRINKHCLLLKVM